MTTLYEQVGGAPAIDRLIEEFYDRIQADPELAKFFVDTSFEHLKRMQKAFFGAALDGPILASDLDIAYAHHGRGIKLKHFNRYVQHLLSVLEDHGIDKDAQMEVIRRISTYVDQVTGEVGSPGD